MNFADFGLGTWHPDKGMYSIVEGMASLGKELGVIFHTNSPVKHILVNQGRASGIETQGKTIGADFVLSGADYHHTETLLPPQSIVFTVKIIGPRKHLLPALFLFYVGLDKKLDRVTHHTLFFDVDFDRHAQQIYDNPEWPSDPLFYANFPSITDPTMAPEGKSSFPTHPDSPRY